MRLPVLPPSPPPPGEDLYEIRERPPVTPVRFVQARNLPPLIVPPRRAPRRPAGQPEAAQAQATAGYQGQERRKAERRVAQQSTLLDTRVERDRRRPVGETGAAGVDLEA